MTHPPLACALIVETDEIDAMHLGRLFRRANVVNHWHLVALEDACVNIRRHRSSYHATWLLLGVNPGHHELDLLRVLRRDPALRDLAVLLAVVDEEAIWSIESMGIAVDAYLIKPIGLRSLEHELQRLSLPLVYGPAQGLPD